MHYAQPGILCVRLSVLILYHELVLYQTDK